MKGMKGSRRAPANVRSRGGGNQTFVPTLDLQAKWHKKFDDAMNDVAHRKKMAKVTLPKIILPDASDGDEK